MYDITNFESLINFKEWIEVFKSGLGEKNQNIPILLVGGKLDLEDSRVCFQEDIKGIAESEAFFNIVECSAKIGKNIDKVFEDLLDEILTKNNVV